MTSLSDIKNNKEDYRFALNLMYKMAINPDIFLEYQYRTEFGPQEALEKATVQVQLYFKIAEGIERELDALPEERKPKEFTHHFPTAPTFPTMIFRRKEKIETANL